MGATVRAARTAGGAGAVLVAAAVALSGLPGTSSLPSAAQNAEGDLVDRLLDIVEQVPIIQPDNILVADLTLERELLGDFIADHRTLAELHDDALQLFVDGDEAGGELGDAVGDAARAVLMLEEGYERWAALELVVPFEAFDDLEVAIGTDPARSLAEQGVDLVQEGQARLAAAYLRLQPLELSAEQETRLDGVVVEARAYQARIEPALRDYARDFTTQELLEFERFSGTAGTAPARAVTYLCIPRGSADALSPAALAEALANQLTFVADDCPALPDPEVLTVDDVPGSDSSSEE